MQKLIKFKNKKTNNMIEKWAKELKRNLIKDDIQMSKKKHMESSSVSYVLRKSEFKQQ